MRIRMIDTIKDRRERKRGTGKRKFLRIVLSVPFWLVLVSVVAIIASSIHAAVIVDARKDRSMSDIWQQGGENSFRHVSVFATGSRSYGEYSPLLYVDQETSLNVADVSQMRTTLQDLNDSAHPSGKTNGLKDGLPNGWEDCYSSYLTADVSYTYDSDSGSRNMNSTACITAVGGNFTAFHPFEYLSGGFLPEICVDSNQIVLNDVLAWNLFRSYDVVGNVVNLLGEEFTVIGVVGHNDSSIDKTTGGDSSMAYIYFSKLGNIYASGYFGTGEDLSSTDVAIGCYEAMLSETVEGVGKTDIITAIPNYSATNTNYYVISNTDRLSIKEVWDFIFPLGQTEQDTASLELPYWEKATELTMTRLFYDGAIICFATIVLIAGVVAFILSFHAKKALPEVIAAVDEDEIDESEESNKDF